MVRPAVAHAATQARQRPTAPYALIHHAITLHDFSFGPVPSSMRAPDRPNHYQGEVTSTLLIKAPGVRTITLYSRISDADTLTGITDASGATLAYADSMVDRVAIHDYPIHQYVIQLAHPATTGDTVRVTLRFSNQREGSLPYLPRTVRSRHPFSTPVPTPWDLKATVPVEYRILSQGRLVSTTPAAGGQHTFHWQQRRPGPEADVAVRLLKTTEIVVSDTWAWKMRRVPAVAVLDSAADTVGARKMFREAFKELDFYSRLTGVPYPWEYLTYADGIGANAAWAIYGVNNYPKFASQDKPVRIGSSTFAHEMAHSWFAAYVYSPDEWLDEGMADFLTAQYLGALWGPWVEQEYLAFRSVPKNPSPILPPVDKGPLVIVRSVAKPRDAVNPYEGGRLLLHILHRYLGDQRFWKGFKAYATGAHPDMTATTDDFQHAMERAAGEPLGWFFDQWAYGDRRPAFRVAADYQSQTRRLTLQIAQTQGPTQVVRPGPALAGRDSVLRRTLAAFRAPVVIRVATARGTLTRRVQLDSVQQTVTIDQVPAAPTMVVFDARDDLWKTLEFPQPTAWLAAQLAQEGAPWQTAWAIEQLQGRGAPDTAAVAALRQAAAHGQHERTRVWAAQALQKLGLATNPVPHSP